MKFFKALAVIALTVFAVNAQSEKSKGNAYGPINAQGNAYAYGRTPQITPEYCAGLGGLAGIVGGRNLCYFNIEGYNQADAHDACVRDGFQSLFTVEDVSDYAELDAVLGNPFVWLNGIKIGDAWYQYSDQTVQLSSSLRYEFPTGECLSFNNGYASGEDCALNQYIKYVCQF